MQGFGGGAAMPAQKSEQAKRQMKLTMQRRMGRLVDRIVKVKKAKDIEKSTRAERNRQKMAVRNAAMRAKADVMQLRMETLRNALSDVPKIVKTKPSDAERAAASRRLFTIDDGRRRRRLGGDHLRGSAAAAEEAYMRYLEEHGALSPEELRARREALGEADGDGSGGSGPGGPSGKSGVVTETEVLDELLKKAPSDRSVADLKFLRTALDRANFFRTLPPTVRDRLSRVGKVVLLRRGGDGGTVFKPGDNGDSAMLVLRGKLQLDTVAKVERSAAVKDEALVDIDGMGAIAAAGGGDATEAVRDFRAEALAESSDSDDANTPQPVALFKRNPFGSGKKQYFGAGRTLDNIDVWRHQLVPRAEELAVMHEEQQRRKAARRRVLARHGLYEEDHGPVPTKKAPEVHDRNGKDSKSGSTSKQEDSPTMETKFFGPGGVIGDAELAGGGTRKSRCSVIRNTVVLVISKHQFLDATRDPSGFDLLARAELLRECAFFGSMQVPSLKRVAQLMFSATFAPGSVALAAGAVSSVLYVIVRGTACEQMSQSDAPRREFVSTKPARASDVETSFRKAKATRPKSAGFASATVQSRQVTRLERGQYFGDVGTLLDLPQPCDVVALTEVHVLGISRADLRSKLSQNLMMTAKALAVEKMRARRRAVHAVSDVASRIEGILDAKAAAEEDGMMPAAAVPREDITLDTDRWELKSEKPPSAAHLKDSLSHIGDLVSRDPSGAGTATGWGVAGNQARNPEAPVDAATPGAKAYPGLPEHGWRTGLLTMPSTAGAAERPLTHTGRPMPLPRRVSASAVTLPHGALSEQSEGQQCANDEGFVAISRGGAAAAVRALRSSKESPVSPRHQAFTRQLSASRLLPQRLPPAVGRRPTSGAATRRSASSGLVGSAGLHLARHRPASAAATLAGSRSAAAVSSAIMVDDGDAGAAHSNQNSPQQSRPSTTGVPPQMPTSPQPSPRSRSPSRSPRGSPRGREHASVARSPSRSGDEAGGIDAAASLESVLAPAAVPVSAVADAALPHVVRTRALSDSFGAPTLAVAAEDDPDEVQQTSRKLLRERAASAKSLRSLAGRPASSGSSRPVTPAGGSRAGGDATPGPAVSSPGEGYAAIHREQMAAAAVDPLDEAIAAIEAEDDMVAATREVDSYAFEPPDPKDPNVARVQKRRELKLRRQPTEYWTPQYKIEATVAIQCMVRVHLAWQLRQLMLEERSAIRLQCMVRKRNARRTLQNVREQRAARRIQCIYRGRRDRLRAVGLKRIQLSLREPETSFDGYGPQHDTAATRVQAAYRGRALRKRKHRIVPLYLTEAAVAIQRISRGGVARLRVARIIMNRAALRIQRMCRGASARDAVRALRAERAETQLLEEMERDRHGDRRQSVTAELAERAKDRVTADQMMEILDPSNLEAVANVETVLEREIREVDAVATSLRRRCARVGGLHLDARGMAKDRERLPPDVRAASERWVPAHDILRISLNDQLWEATMETFRTELGALTAGYKQLKLRAKRTAKRQAGLM